MIKTTLMEAIKSEKDVKIHKKLIAVNMVHNKNCSTSFAAETVGVTQRSVQLWLEQFDNGGIKGLRTLPQEGRPPLVPRIRIKKIASRLCNKGKLTPKKLQRKIYNKYRVKYSMCNIRKILNWFDYTLKVPTRTYVMASSKSECTKWQNKNIPEILRKENHGFTVVIQDESIFVHDSMARKKHWSLRGKRVHKKSTGSHTKMIVYGAITSDGMQLFRLYPKFNGDTFVVYLEDLRLRWGKVLVIVDNAPQHKSCAVKEYLKKHKDVILYYLPTYSPQLSAIEECWRQAKYELVHSEYYETAEKMWAVVSEYFRNKRFNLDIYRYLERSV